MALHNDIESTALLLPLHDRFGIISKHAFRNWFVIVNFFERGLTAKLIGVFKIKPIAKD